MGGEQKEEVGNGRERGEMGGGGGKWGKWEGRRGSAEPDGSSVPVPLRGGMLVYYRLLLPAFCQCDPTIHCYPFYIPPCPRTQHSLPYKEIQEFHS